MSSKPNTSKRLSKTSAQSYFGIGFVVPFIPPEPSASQHTQSAKLEFQHQNEEADIKCLPTNTSVSNRSSEISGTDRQLQTTAAVITSKTSATNNGNSTGGNELTIQHLPVESETNQSHLQLTNAFSAVKELFTTESNFFTKLSLLESVSVEF